MTQISPKAGHTLPPEELTDISGPAGRLLRARP